MVLKLNNNSVEFNGKIKESFQTLFGEVDGLISELKLKSSEEILNGSVAKAQELLSQIVPYEKFYKRLKSAKDAFEEIENGSQLKDSEEETKITEDIEVNKTEEVEEEKEDNDHPDFSSQENFRIPILKALIFLGGSSEEVDVTEFVKKDMKNKLTDIDQEIPDGEDKERWLSSVYFETATMIDEGLLNNDSSKKWEIAQKGIDYLGKYGK